MTDSIPGLVVKPRYISDRDERRLLDMIGRQPWLTDLKRRVQHYGYRYDYRARQVNADSYLGPLPDWLVTLADRLHADSHAPAVPDQVVINEYEPGQGIAPHVDCVPCFGDTVLSLSLGSVCVMEFSRKTGDGQLIKVPLLLEPGSLVVMRGPARYDWRHGIPPRKADRLDGRIYIRDRRVSVTFRTVVPGD